MYLTCLKVFISLIFFLGFNSFSFEASSVDILNAFTIIYVLSFSFESCKDLLIKELYLAWEWEFLRDSINLFVFAFSFAKVPIISFAYLQPSINLFLVSIICSFYDSTHFSMNFFFFLKDLSVICLYLKSLLIYSISCLYL